MQYKTKDPKDYEVCDHCGFDHNYEPEQAWAWHTEHPCVYCKYNDKIDASVKNQHAKDCPVAMVLFFCLNELDKFPF